MLVNLLIVYHSIEYDDFEPGFLNLYRKYNVDVCESPTNQRQAQLTNVLKHIFFQKLKIKIPLNNLKIMTQNGAF